MNKKLINAAARTGLELGSSEDVGELVASAEDLLRSTASYSGAEIEAARIKLKGQLDSVRERAGLAGYSFTRGVRQVSQATDGYVRDHTWSTVGAAAAVGVLAGICLMSTPRGNGR
jgi:ElaB/YqjD/DUF883 family membrane-anchored ribosome-binding protein